MPNFVFDEIRNYLDDILLVSPYLKIEILNKIKELKKKFKIIETKTIPKKYINMAIDIVKDIDADDMFFVAINLYKHHKIWTGDRVLINGLKKKGYDICITTAELKEYIFKK